jgi:hypothetical protein
MADEGLNRLDRCGSIGIGAKCVVFVRSLLMRANAQVLEE